MAPCCGGTRVEDGDELVERSGQPKGMYRSMHMSEWPSAYSAHSPALRLMNPRMEEVGVLSVATLRLCVSLRPKRRLRRCPRTEQRVCSRINR